MCRCDGYTRCTEYSLPFRRDLFVSVIMLGIYRPEFARWNFILAKKNFCTKSFLTTMTGGILNCKLVKFVAGIVTM